MTKVICPSCDTKFEVKGRLDDFETSTVCPDCNFKTATWQFDQEPFERVEEDGE